MITQQLKNTVTNKEYIVIYSGLDIDDKRIQKLKLQLSKQINTDLNYILTDIRTSTKEDFLICNLN